MAAAAAGTVELLQRTGRRGEGDFLAVFAFVGRRADDANVGGREPRIGGGLEDDAAVAAVGQDAAAMGGHAGRQVLDAELDVAGKAVLPGGADENDIGRARR